MSNQDYSVKQLLEMGACTNCQLCADVCPAVNASENGELSAIYYRMKGLTQVLKGRGGLLRNLLGRKPPSGNVLDRFSDTVFRCTLCGNCQEICPVGIHLKDLWLSLRQDMVHSGHYPKKIDMIRGNLDETNHRMTDISGTRRISSILPGARPPIFHWPKKFPWPLRRSWTEAAWISPC